MKKVLLGIAGIIILAFVVVLFVNASNDPKEDKKAVVTNESSMDCGKCASSTSAACASKAETSEVKPAAGSCCSTAAH